MTRILGEMTWEEAEGAIPQADYVVLPTGSFEQHSLHLPLLTDSIRAEKIVEDLGQRAERQGLHLLLLPTLVYGCSDHHLNFAGTISISFGTYIDLLIDVGRCLAKHRAKRLLVISFHGGNKPPIVLAGGEIQRRFNLDVHSLHWTDIARPRIREWVGSDRWGHGGEYETSMIMHLAPDLVRLQKVVDQGERHAPKTKLTRYSDDLRPLGGKGDPRRASALFAEKLISEVNEDLIQVLKADAENGARS